VRRWGWRCHAGPRRGSAVPAGPAQLRGMHLADMSKPQKPVNYSALRSLLNRIFGDAKKEARTPEEYRAIDEQERDASRLLLDELIHGNDDGEWIRHA